MCAAAGQCHRADRPSCTSSLPAAGPCPSPRPSAPFLLSNSSAVSAAEARAALQERLGLNERQANAIVGAAQSLVPDADGEGAGSVMNVDLRAVHEVAFAVLLQLDELDMLSAVAHGARPASGHGR